jgi:hypothetical protein
LAPPHAISWAWSALELLSGSAGLGFQPGRSVACRTILRSSATVAGVTVGVGEAAGVLLVVVPDEPVLVVDPEEPAQPASSTSAPAKAHPAEMR